MSGSPVGIGEIGFSGVTTNEGRRDCGSGHGPGKRNFFFTGITVLGDEITGITGKEEIFD
ncbi:MAG: hypothetical protein WC379_11345 [Methanoregula sp.]|jgi:hypothetical protein